MTRYKVDLTRSAQKDLRTIRDRRVRDPIEAAILALADDPRPPGVKKLVGRGNEWRIRVGDWRVIYLIEDGRLVVLVVSVGARGGVYG